jgi:hypothetical protein
MNRKYIGIMWAILAIILMIVCVKQRETIDKQQQLIRVLWKDCR